MSVGVRRHLLDHGVAGGRVEDDQPFGLEGQQQPAGGADDRVVRLEPGAETALGAGRGGRTGVRRRRVEGVQAGADCAVARLRELDAAGALPAAHVRASAQVGGVHVRAGAQVGGVNVCTVWRRLEAARTEGRMERRPRAGPHS
jgi:hypothetical protein